MHAKIIGLIVVTSVLASCSQLSPGHQKVETMSANIDTATREVASSSGYDFKKLENLHNLDGVGTTNAANKDEQNTVCHIDIDTQDNYFKVVMPFSVYDQLSISGDRISETSTNRSSLTLKTDKYDPGKSNLCGDWKKASYVQDVLEISTNSDNSKQITIKKSFRCLLSTAEVSMSCKLNSKK